jgi:hypothetical protein
VGNATVRGLTEAAGLSIGLTVGHARAAPPCQSRARAEQDGDPGWPDEEEREQDDAEVGEGAHGLVAGAGQVAPRERLCPASRDVAEA